MSPLGAFFAGTIAAGYVVAGLFFTKFWRRTRDVLFLAFAVAFGLLALTQFLLTITEAPNEERSWVYLFRLVAFVLIAVAIVHKNAGPRS
jgi:hypothetical protein